MNNRTPFTPLALTLLVSLVVACGGDAPTDPLADGPFAEATLELTLESPLLSPPDAPSEGIIDLVPMSDGTLWVLDQMEEDARIRRFDEEGRLLGQVGGTGWDPGEYLTPRSLTRLPGDRVAVIDPGITGRFTIYDADGSVSALAPHADTSSWAESGRAHLEGDSLLWVLMRAGMGRARLRNPPVFSRKDFDGETLDTVHLPDFPEVEWARVEIPQLSGARIFRMPFEPALDWTVDRSGRFLFTRGEPYRIERYGPLDGDRGAVELLIEREVTPVVITRAERRQLDESLRARASEMRWGSEVEIPEIRRTKAPVRGIRVAVDGRILVHVALPSKEEEGEWIAPNGWDIFEPDGTFLARVSVPHDVEVRDLRGDHLWGLRTDASGAQSIVRYRLEWPWERPTVTPDP